MSSPAPEPSDPVADWEALRGSYDAVQIITAGVRLCDALVRLREIHAKVETAHALALHEVEEERDELQSEINASQDVDDDGLVYEIEQWHSADGHPDGWAVCPHVVCRAAKR